MYHIYNAATFAPSFPKTQRQPIQEKLGTDASGIP